MCIGDRLLRLVEPWRFAGGSRGRGTVAEQSLSARAFLRRRPERNGGVQSLVPHLEVIRPDPEEALLRRDLEAFLTREYQQKRIALDLLSALLQAADSSPAALGSLIELRLAALRGKVRRPRKPEPDDGSQPMAQTWRAILAGSTSGDRTLEIEFLENLIREADQLRCAKLDALLALLETIDREQPRARVLVLTRFRETLEFLGDRLRGRRAFSLFHRGLEERRRISLLTSFQRNLHGSTLIAVDRALPGHSLAPCHYVIHFDLPWDPLVTMERVHTIRHAEEGHPVRQIVLVFPESSGASMARRQERLGLLEVPYPGLENLCLETRDCLVRAALASSARCDEWIADGEDLLARAAQLKEAARAGDEPAPDAPAAVSAAPEDALPEAIQPESFSEDLENIVFTFLTKRYQVKIKKHRARVFFLSLSKEFLLDFPQFARADYMLTFDAEQARKDPRLDYFAVGHEVVDAALSRCKTEDSAQTIVHRRPRSEEHAGFTGYQFVFLVRVVDVSPRDYVVSVVTDRQGNLHNELNEVLLDSSRRFNHHEDGRKTVVGFEYSPEEVDACHRVALEHVKELVEQHLAPLRGARASELEARLAELRMRLEASKSRLSALRNGRGSNRKEDQLLLSSVLEAQRAQAQRLQNAMEQRIEILLYGAGLIEVVE